MSKFELAYAITVALSWVNFITATIIGMFNHAQAALVMLIINALVMIPMHIAFWFKFYKKKHK